MTELSPRVGLTIPKEDGSDDANLAALLRALGLDAENKMPGITSMPTATRTALTGAAMFNGRVVYDTDLSTLFLGDGTTWRALARLDTAGHLHMSGKKITGLADGTAGGDAVTKAQLDVAIPIGVTIPYAGPAGAELPANWLLCDGRAVSRSTYAALFAVISTTYGTGNGTTTFNLPDLRGRTVAGLDNMGGTDAGRLSWTNQLGGVGPNSKTIDGGKETVALSPGQMPAHSHGGATGPDNPDHSHKVNLTRGGSQSDSGGTAGWLWHSYGDGVTTFGASDRHTHSIGTEGNDEAHNNMQPTILQNYIIKAS